MFHTNENIRNCWFDYISLNILRNIISIDIVKTLYFQRINTMFSQHGIMELTERFTSEQTYLREKEQQKFEIVYIKSLFHQNNTTFSLI